MTESLPVHFFTIVLNGEPFIRYHIDALRQLKCQWHWHVVEGVAKLVHDTGWSVATGGAVKADFHDRGRSNDGTSAYLDEIAKAFPGNVTIYRKPIDEFWNGKIEMVSAPLPALPDDCLLWQVDADELWRPEDITRMRDAFAAQPHRTAAYFWCDYFVAPDAVISTRNSYGMNPKVEWLRVWRYRRGDRWLKHEPPMLMRRNGLLRRRVNVAKIAPFRHADTEAMGIKFEHMAYVTDAQLAFKETYYGYAGATDAWRRLRAAVQGGPVLLRHYFGWVHDNACADSIRRLGIRPMAVQDPSNGRWQFITDGPASSGTARA
jgi:hypothetical protein